MASSIISDYRKHLASAGKLDYIESKSDEELAFELYQALRSQGRDFEKYAANRNDPEFAQLVRDQYEKDTELFKGAIEAPISSFESKKAGVKQGLATVAGSVGLDGTERSLMRSARKNQRKANKYQRRAFDDIQMIDDPMDLLKYASQGMTSAVTDIVPDIILSLVTRGIGGKLQKGISKTDKLKKLDKKAKKIFGDDYGKNIGTIAGGVASSTLENTGHVYGDLYQYTRLDPSDDLYLDPGEARALSMLGGGASGAMDSILPTWLASKLAKSIGGKQAKKEVTRLFESIPDGLVMLPKGAAAEGATEAMQEMIQMMVVKYHTDEDWNANDWNRLANAGALGAIGGGTVSGGTAALSKLLAPTEKTIAEEQDDDAPIESIQQRVEIRNRNSERRFSEIEVGTIVSPAGSNRLARVVEKPDEGNEVVVEFRDGLTKRVKATELNIKEDKSKIIKPEDLEHFSDEKLEDLLQYRPSMSEAITAEQERRKVEVEEEESLKRLDTKLEATEKNNQIIVSDLSSGERIYSAVYAEEDGVLKVVSSNEDMEHDQRMDKARELVSKSLRSKARKLGLPYQVGQVVEYPVSYAEIEQMDDKAQVLQEYARVESQINLLGKDVGQLKGLLIDKMIDMGLVTRAGDGTILTSKVEVKKGSNSALITNNPNVADVLAGNIFADLEGRLDDYQETLNSTQLNEKFMLAEAKELASDLAEELGLNRADVNRISEASVRLFKKYYLDEKGKWKGGETNKDKADKEYEKQQIELLQKQEAKDRFESINPQQGNFVQLAKGGELQKITSIDPENFTIKTAESGEIEIPASGILRQTSDRPKERNGEIVTELSNGNLTKTILVTGSDTDYSHKGKKSLRVTFNPNGEIIGVKDSKGKSYDEPTGTSIDEDDIVGILARYVLTPKTSINNIPKPLKPVKIADAIYRKGATLGTSEFVVDGTKKIGKYEVEPVLEGSFVSGFKVQDGDQEQTLEFKEPVKPSVWVDAARSKLKDGNLWGSNQAKKRKLVPIENSLTFRSRSDVLINPQVSFTEAESADDDSIIRKVEKSNSKSTKSAVVLRYFHPESETPKILVRRVLSDKDGVASIQNMRRRGGKAIDPLAPTANSSIKVGSDNDIYLDSLDEDSEDRIEFIGVLQSQEEFVVNANFDSEESFRNALDPYTDYAKIRENPIAILEAIDSQIESTEDIVVAEALDLQKSRIDNLINEDGEFNPTLDIWGGIAPSVLKDLRTRADNLSSGIKDPELRDKARRVAKDEKIRLFTLKEFLGGISEKKGDWSQGLKRLGESNLDQVGNAIRLADRELARNGYKPRKKKGEGADAASRVVAPLNESIAKGAAPTQTVNSDDIDPNETDYNEAEITPDSDFSEEEALELGEIEDVQEPEEDEVIFRDIDSESIEEVDEPLDEGLISTAQAVVDTPTLDKKDKASLMIAISAYQNSQGIDRRNKYKELDDLLIELFTMRPMESVGEIATEPAVIEREIAFAKEEQLEPSLPPLSEELLRENEEGILRFLGGAKIDGEPIGLAAYLRKARKDLLGSTELEGDLLDMAEQLLAHPYTKNLKVQFLSWDKFKIGATHDGSSGKITRAYLRGDTIVLGPVFKTSESSDLSVDDQIRVTMLEEAAHRVLSNAIDIAIQTKKNDEIPSVARGVMTKDQALKIYNDTKDLMEWLRTQADGEYYHGLLNPQEFWANFATNPRFRKFLNRPMPDKLRRKFQSRFERVIDWILDLASKILDADFSRSSITIDVVRKKYRSLLRASDKLAANDIDIRATMNSESRDKIDFDLGITYNIQDGKTQDKTFSSLPKIIATAENLQGKEGKQAFYRAAVDSGYEITGQNLRSKLEGLDQKIGTEHGVYFDDDAGRVIKVTRIPESMMSFGHFYDVGRYIRDKHNMNLLFGDDIQFVGVSPREDGDYAIITSQPLIEGDEATTEQIIADLEGKGYKVTLTPNWEDNGATQEISAVSEDGTIEISDVAPKNVLVDDETGELAYIDVHVVAPDDLASRIEYTPLESADTIDQPSTIAEGTIRAHMVALKDLGNVIGSALSEVGEESTMTVEKIKEYQVIDKGSTPDVIAKVLADKMTTVEEAKAQYTQALPETSRPSVDDINSINQLESVANRDTAARNLMKLLLGVRSSAVDLLAKSVQNKTKTQNKLEDAEAAISRLTSPKKMFDAAKTQKVFHTFISKAIYHKERSKVNSFEASMIKDGADISMTDFKKLRDIDIDESKLYNLLDTLSKGIDGTRFLEQLPAEEIFNRLESVDNIHSLVARGEPDSDLDQAVRASIALMLGTDQANQNARSAFTARLRLASGEVGVDIDDAVKLIKDAANGRPTRDVKNKSMLGILNNVRKLHDDIKQYKKDLAEIDEEIRVGDIHVKAYEDRIADLDEYFDTSAPVELRDGGLFSTLEIDSDGKMVETNFIFRIGNGEGSDEAKYSAARASELDKIMSTQGYKDKYLGTPKHRYFTQLVAELRKPNFGLQYHTANVGFIHSIIQPLQQRLSNLGPAGKMVATLLNQYNRDYNAEVGRINAQGRKVSKALGRLHSELGATGENLNVFITDFGSKIFDWFNERPDLQGQEELAINRIWKHLGEIDPSRNLTESGKKALRAYLKQWSIQNDNFRRLYQKYDIKVEDENIVRGEIASGTSENLFRNFVEQGVFTTPRKLNKDKVFRVASLINPKFQEGSDEDQNIFNKIKVSLSEAVEQGKDFNESFQQILGKSVSPELANLFFSTIFDGKSVHNVPFVAKLKGEETTAHRIILPEEMQRAWRTAKGNNPGIRVANAINKLAQLVPDNDETTVIDLLSQFKHRADALIKVHKQADEEATSINVDKSLMKMLKGAEFHHSIHGRALYNILPGEFFEYEMYDETSSSQHLSKILMTANFGRKGEKLSDNFSAIKDYYKSAADTYSDLASSVGLKDKPGSRLPQKFKKAKIIKEMEARGMDPSGYKDLENRAKAFWETERVIAGVSAAFTSRSSNNEDLSAGLDFLRTLAFGLVNTMKGAWTATMSMPDIVKVLGLNPTAFRTLGKAGGNLVREVTGSLLESFGVEMVRGSKYNEELRDMYGRDRGMLSFSEQITEIGKQGSINKAQQGFRKIVNTVQALSEAGASMRSKTSVNFIPASVLTPFTAPFSYLAQAVNKSISLAMADTIERFVLKTVDALDARGIDLSNNTFEIKPEDIGYEESKLDSYIFGSMDMVNKLNQRLTAEGMSFTQLAQDFRRRQKLDPNAKVLSIDAVRAAQNIAMSEVTYDTMSGKPSAALSGAGQWFSPLLSWSVSSYNKGMDQMRNKEGRLAMRESMRYMLTSAAWLMPVGIAFTLFMDWWDEEVLGKPSSLRKVPPSAAIPGVGTFMAMADPRFEVSAMLERAARANNILGIGQEFFTPMLVGQLDPSSLAARFDPTRRVLAISSVMNAYAVATNYFNAIRTGGKEELVPDYATVVRPLMYLMGLNAVIQNTQALTNLTDIEDYDPTGFMSNERQSADITGMRNSFRVFAKALGMEMRRGGLMQFSATAISNAVKRMERAAYANDKIAFKDAYRRALELSQAEDRRKDVADKFKNRHLRNGVTRFALTDSDIKAMLSVMDPPERNKILLAMRNHDAYLRAIGGKPKKPKKDVGQYKEELRRLAL